MFAENKFLQDKTFNGIAIAQKLSTLRSGDLLVLAYDLSGVNDRTVASKYYPIWLYHSRRDRISYAG